MYMMPEFGPIIALKPSRRSGFQHFMHPEYSSSDNSSACYLVFFANEDDTVKDADASLMCSWKVTI